MIKAKYGEVIFEGERCSVIAEAVTVLRVLKKLVSDEEYKTVIRLADKSKQQLSDEAEEAREKLKKLLGL